MAESGLVEVYSDGDDSRKWYCHTCERETEPTLPDYVCSHCHTGFIEQIDRSGLNDNAEQIDVEEYHDGDDLDMSFEDGAEDAGTPADSQHSIQRTHIAVHRLQPGMPGMPVGMPSGLPTGLPGGLMIPNLMGPGTAFQDFVSQLMTGLLSGAFQNSPFNIMFGVPQNLGDYVVSAGGLDNVITMLLNQLDGAGGPPPASGDDIEAIPTVAITQDQVDANVQCHVCMEDFQLAEQVRSLPCNHVYHSDCIVPWLQLHGTCPICRKPIVKRQEREANPSASTSTSADVPPD